MISPTARLKKNCAGSRLPGLIDLGRPAEHLTDLPFVSWLTDRFDKAIEIPVAIESVPLLLDLLGTCVEALLQLAGSHE